MSTTTVTDEDKLDLAIRLEKDIDKFILELTKLRKKARPFCEAGKFDYIHYYRDELEHFTIQIKRMVAD